MDTNPELELMIRGPASGSEVEVEAVSSSSMAMTGEEAMRMRILKTLEIFPRLTISMMQTGLGPHHPPKFWRPILNSLLREGQVVHLQEQHQNEKGRYRTVTIYTLEKNLRDDDRNKLIPLSDESSNIAECLGK